MSSQPQSGTPLKTIVRIMNLACAAAIIAITIVDVITVLELFAFWRWIFMTYQFLFALMILAAELRLDFILKYFRFLEGNIGKGWFLIFCGMWLIGYSLASTITGSCLIFCGFVTTFILSCSVRINHYNIEMMIAFMNFIKIIKYHYTQQQLMGNKMMKSQAEFEQDYQRKQEMKPSVLALNLLIKKKGRVSTEYQFLTPPIGKGQYSEIRKVINKKTGIMRAVKIVQKNATEKEEERVSSEVNILEKLDHPNILKINEYYSDDRFHYIITDFYSGGELFSKIQERRIFSEAYAARIIRQLLYAVNYCHLHGIAHREIRPENIMLEKSSEFASAILIDFGMCQKISHKMHSSVNHPYYQAPEIQQKKYNESIDIWAIGVITYILLCGYPPFGGDTNRKIIDNVLKKPLIFDEQDWIKNSNESKEFVRKILVKDPNQRITIDQALNDPWIVKNYELQVTDSQLRRVLTNLMNYNCQSKLQEATLKLIVLYLASREELSELREVFTSIDSKNDGYIDVEELQTAMLKIFDSETAERQSNKICNEDDTLSYSQFLAQAIDKQAILQKSKIETAFKLIDRNASGNINVEELSEAFKCNLTGNDYWIEIMNEQNLQI
ncbi:unnamed protein product [Paramecium pentaurelia]|uniref:non-specific serine/threonine protein kinase n=1 Tax=Paramecium pentaurelia TaxID=43138 RepID=A0A8S1WAQ3_9CILI|nr:unnamed protein product [Paramecium pentaurelia]